MLNLDAKEAKQKGVNILFVTNYYYIFYSNGTRTTNIFIFN